MPDDQNHTTVTDRDRELAAYWTERGDLRAWLANIIHHARADERERSAQIAERPIKVRGGAEWALDEGHNQACRRIAAAIREGT